ncbi:hypothetical protein Pyn_27909 [Prunus yedoensis var. nudiflora]|uniref:Uncharacterized protein n=1 Tax=Prunus yedoensis var. nudiflora TaxID=2094558 RepID=A0A314Y1V7_PRUYE|nr:hypothetical protein Pyn_27909 [Prunus yedoensis var. nudiflora]
MQCNSYLPGYYSVRDLMRILTIVAGPYIMEIKHCQTGSIAMASCRGPLLMLIQGMIRISQADNA